MFRRCCAVLVVVLVALPVSASGAVELDGAAVYRQNCVACHGAAADGRGPAAMALRPAPPDLTDPEWWAARTDAEVAASVRSGIPGTSMVPYAAMSEEELSAMVAWLRTQSAE